MTASTTTKPMKAEPSKVRTNLIVPTFRSKPLQMVKHPYKNRVTLGSKKTVDPSSSRTSATRNELFQHFTVSTNPADELSYAFENIEIERSVDTSVKDDKRTSRHYPTEADPFHSLMLELCEDEVPENDQVRPE